MRFLNIGMENFRNISSASIETDAEDIVLVGTNGQGKTNFLEALYILCYGSSFKTSYLKEAVGHGGESFRLEARFLNDFDEIQNIRFLFDKGRRYIEIDGKEIKDRKELIYQFPCIVFCHEDMDFIKGEPETRRKFFDQTMSLYSPLFFDDLRTYRNILAKRNAAIKNGQTDIISIYDMKLAETGLSLMKERKEAVDDFNKIFPVLYSKVSNGKNDLHISYQSSWMDVSSVSDVVRLLEERRDVDMRMMTTTSGIHRDRFVVRDSNGIFSQTGSTGQLRLCSLIFRIAEAESFYRMTGKKPILLIDDVLLELDDEKRALFLDNLSLYSQAFFTFLPRENYFASDHRKPMCYNVSNGGFFLV